MDPIIELSKVTKTYRSKGKAVLALKDVNLPVERGSFTTLIGPSGCGKSTLLKIIAGIALPYEGRMRYKDREITSINTDIGFVTQDSNLFPWLTLIQNVELALKIRGVARDQRKRTAQKYIDTMQLSGFESHYPFELSGGMQKRAGLARAMALDPSILLVDEPSAGLDPITTREIDQLLLERKRTGTTLVVVTHNIPSARLLGDELAVLHEGRIIARGSAADLDASDDPLVQGFMRSEGGG